MSLTLTTFDENSLRAWLYRQLAQGKTPLSVLQTALETPVEELIPWPEKIISFEETTDEPHSVQDVFFAVCGSVPESQRGQFQELADQLAHRLMPPKDLVFLTHYFVTHWLPRLGSGPGWFVTMLRDRGYINTRTGEFRDEVILPGGYIEAARCLGLKRVKTVWEWLKSTDVSNFVQEIGREEGAWEDAPRRFKICLGEPMTDVDQARASESLEIRLNGANDTLSTEFEGEHSGASDIHNSIDSNSIGASDTHREAQSVFPVGAIDTHNGAPGIHKPGANGTHPGASDMHRHGASGTLDWRDWHSLNTLALGLNHENNTSTTPSDRKSSEEGEIPYDDMQGVVGMEWDLNSLLDRNRVSAKNQELLVENGLSAQAFVSWLLYAASPSGNGIRDPIAHAISRLIPDPGRGAGGASDQLAGLPANELTDMLIRELNGQSPWNQTWRKTMEGAPRSRLRTLADQLGVPAPDSGYW